MKLMRYHFQRLYSLKSLLNILGLALGLASFTILSLYVNYEHSYDSFYGNSDKVYRAYINYVKDGNIYEQDACSYNKTGSALLSFSPDIKLYTRLFPLHQCGIINYNQTYEVNNVFLADDSFFEVFGYTLKNGTMESALSSPNSIVLSQSESNKLFGTANPIGKQLEIYAIDKTIQATVTGVMNDLPSNTHMPINYLISFSTSNQWGDDWDLNWNNNMFYTYFLTHNSLNIKSFNDKLKKLDFPEKGREFHAIEPLSDIHLNSNKSFEIAQNSNNITIHLLISIAFLILLLTWVNYSSFLINQSIERSKGTGIKRVFGASKTNIVIQFVRDSLITNLFAVIILVVCFPVFIALFNAVSGENVSMEFFQTQFILLLIIIITIGAIVTGIYPAFILSKYNPLRIIKGLNKTNQKFTLRKVLVIFQFSLTIILITCSITIFKQLKHIQNQPKGFESNKTIVLSGNVLQKNTDDDYKLLKFKLKQHPLVESVTTSQTVPGQGFSTLNSFSHIKAHSGNVVKNIVWYNYSIDKDYLNVFKIDIIAGSNFNGSKTETSNNVILNEKAVRLLGFKDVSEAIGKQVSFWGNSWIIKGVIANYKHFGAHRKIEPLVLTHQAFNNQFCAIKLMDINNDTCINSIEKIWAEVFLRSTFKYFHLENQLQTLYDNEKKLSSIFGLFTIISIFIACLGLWSLSHTIILKKRKEIGIRKVNGASIIDIVVMLNLSILKWISISFIAAVPISFVFMSKWLENYSSQTTLNWWIFILAGFITIFISLITVSANSIKAALQNPVNSIQYE